MSLPPVRRVVTGHDAQGRAIVVTDDRPASVSNLTGTTQLTLLWTTNTTPIDNDDAIDGRQRAVDLTLPGGTVLRMVDMAPGSRSAMHRTSSLDYGIVLSGTIELELDGGAITRVEAGDVVIQRGTIHAWRNPSPDATARMAFTLLDAHPATVDGVPLPDISPRPGPSKS